MIVLRNVILIICIELYENVSVIFIQQTLTAGWNDNTTAWAFFRQASAISETLDKVVMIIYTVKAAERRETKRCR